MFCVLILALLGLFGDGPLSEEKIEKNGISVRFDQFLRRESDSEIEIIAPASNGQIRISVASDFFDVYKIEQITPEPPEPLMRDGKTILEFPVIGEGRLTLFLTVREGLTGRTTSTLNINGADFMMSNYVYP